MLRVYGENVENVIIEGADSETYLDCSDDENIAILFADRTQISLHYDDETGIWKISVERKGTAKQKLVPYKEGVSEYDSDEFTIESHLDICYFLDSDAQEWY